MFGDASTKNVMPWKGGSKQKTENASNVKTLKVHYLYNLKRKELEKVAELWHPLKV